MTIADLITRSVFMRLVLAVVAVVLAHDLLMAADSHATSHDTDAHHQEATQVCGPVEGARVPEQQLPPISPPVAFITPTLISTLQFESECPGHQLMMLADASSLRAMLQVFLN